MEYDKPYLSYKDQADKLAGLGMGGSKSDIMERLEQVGYYRLSGYWHDYRQLDGKGFREGATIDAVWSDYIFDRQFRLVVLYAIERVEIYTRARLAHKLARDTGAFGFEAREGLPRLSEGDYKRFIDKCKSKHTSSREPFEVHFRGKYGDANDIPKHDVRWHEPYEVRPHRMFSILTILSYLLNYVAPSTSRRTRLMHLLDGRGPDKLRCMGFSEGWRECPFWKPYVVDHGDGSS